jgi:hypothetical protein
MSSSSENQFGQLTLMLSTAAERGVEVVWTGRSSEREPSRLLAPFFSSVLKQASTEGLPLTMRFERLDHFNSSTVTTLIAVIRSAQTQGVALTLTYDSQRRWQSLSFEALRVFEQPDGMFRVQPVL